MFARILVAIAGVVLAGVAVAVAILAAVASQRCGFEGSCDSPTPTATIVAEVVLALLAAGSALAACASAFSYTSTADARRLRTFAGWSAAAACAGGLWLAAFAAAIS